jgi:hypothetical protein
MRWEDPDLIRDECQLRPHVQFRRKARSKKAKPPLCRRLVEKMEPGGLRGHQVAGGDGWLAGPPAAGELPWLTIKLQ